MILAALIGCGVEPDEGSSPVEEPPLCAEDGEFTVDLPLGNGALRTLDDSEILAADLLGAEPSWRGDLRGLMLDAEGRPAGDGQIPSNLGTLVRTGWTTTWCADDREVAISAGRTEAIAVCAATTTACDDAPVDPPRLDADAALAVAPEGPGFLYAVFYPFSENHPESFWQVIWHAGTGQLYALVDAESGEVLPCSEEDAETCRDLDSL